MCNSLVNKQEVEIVKEVPHWGCVVTGYEHTGAIHVGVCSQTPPSILPGPADLHETLSTGNTVSHKSCPLPGWGTTPQGPSNTSAYLGSLTTVKMYLIKMAIMDFAWSSSVDSSPVRCQQTVVAVVTMAYFGCWGSFHSATLLIRCVTGVSCVAWFHGITLPQAVTASHHC